MTGRFTVTSDYCIRILFLKLSHFRNENEKNVGCNKWEITVQYVLILSKPEYALLDFSYWIKQIYLNHWNASIWKKQHFVRKNGY